MGQRAGRLRAASSQHIHLHAARPAGVNEPTRGRRGGARRKSCDIVAALGPDDLCLCLLSGGGSALLPAPVEGITLEDKLAVTRLLSAAGANIQQLNIVRKQLSRIKGGGLARACRAGRLISLIISDVPGDPLDLIASGPTVEDHSTPAEALAILRQFARSEAEIPAAVLRWLMRPGSARPDSARQILQTAASRTSLSATTPRRSMRPAWRPSGAAIPTP